MSASNDDPAISYDPDTRVVTIDGFRFTRELFSAITASPPDIRFRIVSRENGVVTLSQERDPLEFAAPDLLAALGPMRVALQKQMDLLRFQARNSTAGLARTLIETAEGWQALCDNAEAAIAKAEPMPIPATHHPATRA